MTIKRKSWGNVGGSVFLQLAVGGYPKKQKLEREKRENQRKIMEGEEDSQNMSTGQSEKGKK